MCGGGGPCSFAVLTVVERRFLALYCRKFLLGKSALCSVAGVDDIFQHDGAGIGLDIFGHAIHAAWMVAVAHQITPPARDFLISPTFQRVQPGENFLGAGMRPDAQSRQILALLRA